MPAYIARVNLNKKVLDFVKSGGPPRRIDLPSVWGRVVSVFLSRMDSSLASSKSLLSSSRDSGSAVLRDNR